MNIAQPTDKDKVTEKVHRTNYLTTEQKDYLNTQAGKQQRIITRVFLKYPHRKMGPTEVHQILFPEFPDQRGGWEINSTRRTMTNLTKAGVLTKTGITHKSLLGGTENKWQLNIGGQPEPEKYPSKNDLLRKHAGKQMDFHGFGWGEK